MPERDLDGLRVLVFCDYYSPESTGGAERVAREVNVRLARRGAQVHVVSAMDGAPYRDADVDVTALQAFDMSPYVKAQLVVSPAYLRRALAAARRFRPSVICAHSLHFHGSLVAAQVARKLHLPLVTVAHVADLGHLRGVTRTIGEAHERTAGRWIMSRSRAVVAVSDAVREHCIDRGAAPAKVVVVHNGVSHSRFPATDEPDDDTLRILCVGRLIANKGPQLLLSAARMLVERNVSFTVTFVGDGPLRSTIERQAVGLPVTCVGASDEVSRWMQSSHVVVRPSYTEGLPLTVLEAMASRRCVVASDIAANREIISHGETGLLHTCGDATSLADELQTLSRLPVYRGALAERGHEVAERFTWAEAAGRHALVLRAVIDQPLLGRSLAGTVTRTNP